MLPSLERVQLLPRLIGAWNRNCRGSRTETWRLAQLWSGSFSNLSATPRVGQPVGDLAGREFGLSFKIGLLFFCRVRIVGVSFNPISQDLDSVSRETNAVPFRAAGSVVCPNWNTTARLRLQWLDSGQVTMLVSCILVDQVQGVQEGPSGIRGVVVRFQGG